MKVFLLRHGTSVNSKDNWPTPSTPLSRLGRKQASVLSSLSRLQMIDLILASKWTRARQTAEILAKAINKPLELFEGIHEREQHPKIYGTNRTGRLGQRYFKDAVNNYNNLDWKFEGQEESVRELIQRAVVFKNHLTNEHLGQNLLVVSHDMFLRSFVAACILGEKYEDKIFNKIFKSLVIVNTGISLLEYDEKWKTWRVWYLNDFSHLKYLKNPARPKIKI